MVQVARTCCTYLASKAKAQIPAARGALAEVPVWFTVHIFLRSVVTCNISVRHKTCHRRNKTVFS